VAAHLRVGANPKDEVAFHRLAGSVAGVGPKSATKMWNEVAGGKPLGQVKVSEKSAKGWSQLVETLRQIAGQASFGAGEGGGGGELWGLRAGPLRERGKPVG
jgi:hypothetical protein